MSTNAVPANMTAWNRRRLMLPSGSFWAIFRRNSCRSKRGNELWTQRTYARSNSFRSDGSGIVNAPFARKYSRSSTGRCAGCGRRKRGVSSRSSNTGSKSGSISWRTSDIMLPNGSDDNTDRLPRVLQGYPSRYERDFRRSSVTAEDLKGCSLSASAVSL